MVELKDCCDPEISCKASDLDKVAGLLGYIGANERCIQDLVINGVITLPKTVFYRDELRVWIYERMGAPLSAKQTRNALYRLRVSGWPVLHRGLGKYEVVRHDNSSSGY